MRSCKLLACIVLAGLPAAADVYVNHEKGSDQASGASPDAPVATLHHAVAIRKPTDRIVIQKCDKPYRESLELIGKMGTPDQPLVVEGSGAVLEGLAVSEVSEWKDEGNGLISTSWGADWGFCVVADGKPAERSALLAKIEPGESFGDYTAHRGYYKLLPSQAIGKTKLEIPRGYCGVVIDESSHILIQNLICQFFWNDGFNIQGNSQNIRLENIVGRFNGDEGVSAHGTADVNVVGADLHHNDNGLCDTVHSRTRYVRVNVHENRSVGVWFQGGDHTLTDAHIFENPAGVILEEGQGAVQLPGFEVNPDVNCRLAMRNVLVQGGAFGVKLAHRSKLVMDHVTLIDQPIGISLAGEFVFAHVINSAIVSSKHSIEGHGGYWGDYNAWANQSALLSDQTLDLQKWTAGKGTDSHSIFVDPRIQADGTPGSNSPVLGKAYVDERHYQSLKHDGFWSDAHPPLIQRDIGADVRSLATPANAGEQPTKH